MPSRKSDRCPTFAKPAPASRGAYVAENGGRSPANAFTRLPGQSRSSVVQILPPLVIRVADHAHNMPAGMQRERTRLAQQLNLTELAQQMIPLPTIAGVATRHQILPRGKAATGPRNHVVQRKFARRQHHTAVLATVAIAKKDVLAREGARLMGNTT